MPERLVRAACPHDCPDTCAMLVTVDESGRATQLTGAPEHPVTAGFLCGKVSTYIDRVYGDDASCDRLSGRGVVPGARGRLRRVAGTPRGVPGRPVRRHLWRRRRDDRAAGP